MYSFIFSVHMKDDFFHTCMMNCKQMILYYFLFNQFRNDSSTYPLVV